MILTHETLTPFFIEVEKDGNHTLKQNKPPTVKRPNGFVTIEGYFPNIESALKKAVKLKAISGEGTIDLETYVNRIEELVNKLTKTKK